MLSLTLLNIAVVGFGIYHIFISEYTVSRRVVGLTSLVFGTLCIYSIFSAFKSISVDINAPMGLLSGKFIFLWGILMSALCFIFNTDLRGGRINKEKNKLCFHLTALVSGSILIYFILGGKETPVNTISDLAYTISTPNVWGRVGLAVISTTAFYIELFFPIFITLRKRERKFSKNAQHFIVLLALLPIIYVMTLLGSLFASLVLSYLWLFILISLNIVLMYSESFLTIPSVPAYSIQQGASTQMRKLEHRIIEKQESAQVENHIIERLHKIMEEDRLYTNPGLTLRDLSLEVGTNRNKIADAIHNMGFAGFYEFINSHRLLLFKELARKNPSKTITELHEEAGFNSRSTFYRFFQVQESMTPNDYVNGIKVSA